MNRCKICVLPSTAHGLTLDSDGVCPICKNYQQSNTVLESAISHDDELKTHIQRIKDQGKGRKYDCIVGMSGGRDSTYLLHELVVKHDLRCLAAYHRTPYTPDVIDGNVRRLVKILNVPLAEMDISREYHRKIARGLTELWFEKPTPIVANLACAPCKFHNHEILKIARQNDIENLIMGSNRYEAFQLGSGQFRYTTPMTKEFGLSKQLLKLLIMFKRGINALSSSIKLWRYFPIGLKAVLYLSPDAPVLRFRYPSIRVLNYFYFTEWSEARCHEILAKVGWELPANCISTWRADCPFGEIKNYMFKKMTGVNYVEAYYSNQIRAGIIDRDEALKRLEKEGRNPARLAEVCRILGLSTDLFA